MARNRIGVALVLLLLVGIVAYQALEHGARSIRLSLALEQCQVFTEMADRAVVALNRDPPDTTEAVQCLEYAHNYYPSGTKQVAGSRLDLIVENSRRASELRIIGALKTATRSDHGNDADAWIEQFKK
jgi:hypothetical protein